MDAREARRLLEAAPVARLATVRPDGGPHVVPIVFALVGDTIWSAVDDKPKRTPRLQRLANLERDPRASVLVDAYDDDWTRLWWVRADGRARVVGPGPERDAGLAALAGKYPPYRERPPAGPALAIDVERWAWWAAGPSPNSASDAV
ncbi:MAG TPA: TIGR03668 family PPOX class F420-dependent oxidoreductase [Actinomycetota bacterium]|nr:TIGR03668 family PPOX class F420-dependent oxidoreductase [Actinomycetota bacterium]